MRIYQKHNESVLAYMNQDFKREGDASDTLVFPLFSQLTEKLKDLLGANEFRAFMDIYLKNP